MSGHSWSSVNFYGHILEYHTFELGQLRPVFTDFELFFFFDFIQVAQLDLQTKRIFKSFADYWFCMSTVEAHIAWFIVVGGLCCQFDCFNWFYKCLVVGFSKNSHTLMHLKRGKEGASLSDAS